MILFMFAAESPYKLRCLALLLRVFLLFSPPPHSGQRSGFVAELQPYSLPEINLLLKDTFHTYGFWLFFHFKSSIP